MAQTQEEPTPPDARTSRETLNANMNGLRGKMWIWIGAVIAVVVLGCGAWWTYVLDRGATGMDADQGDMGGQMGGIGTTDAPRFPPVTGFYEGEQIAFIHTEASDPKVADMLTGMMGSPVITVPELAEVPDSALSDVYVFTNGVQPDEAQGPMGSQPDIFDSAPGDDDYSPLLHPNGCGIPRCPPGTPGAGSGQANRPQSVLRATADHDHVMIHRPLPSPIARDPTDSSREAGSPLSPTSREPWKRP